MLRLPIIARPLRGYWWLPTSRGKVLRILGGTYEREQTAHFIRWVRPGATVIDIGAHSGYYTLLASALVGKNGSVWAFESEPINAGFLRQHTLLNHCTNVRVEEIAVSNANGHSRFRFGTGSGTGRLDANGDVEVRTVQLGDFCSSRGIRPSALKIDVEGGELAVLEGAAELIYATRPVIFLSTHGATTRRQCIEWLQDAGYSLHPILGLDVSSATEILGVQDGTIA